MLSRLYLCTLCLSIVAAPVWANDEAAFSCTGVFGPQSSEALLIETYGAQNVVTGMVPGAYGQEMLATTVFPNDPDKSMQFVWWDEDTREGLNFADLPPSIDGLGGVHIGMTVAEVLAINGQPFTMSGFWWELGGYAKMEEGTLAYPDDVGCFLSLQFSPAEDYPRDLDVSAVSGEVTIASDDPLLEKLDTRVSVVNISIIPYDE